jgi:formiminotetrahydrofolate cyclodeaminase
VRKGGKLTISAEDPDLKKSRHLDISVIIRIFVINTRAMTTKLTLTVEKAVIEKAKSYAKLTGRSLSELVEKYLESLTNDEKNDAQISPKLRKIVGAVKLPKNFDEEKELRTYLEKKHL